MAALFGQEGVRRPGTEASLARGRVKWSWLRRQASLAVGPARCARLRRQASLAGGPARYAWLRRTPWRLVQRRARCVRRMPSLGGHRMSVPGFGKSRRASHLCRRRLVGPRVVVQVARPPR